jgi:UDP-2,3-diacylglucosamine hydrolase
MHEKKALLLLKFLKSFPEDGTHLFFLGDIFDIWIGDHQFYEKEYKLIIDEIRRLLDRGVKMFFFEGNHDFHIKEFWEGRLGVRVFDSPQYFDLGKLRLRIEHGDFSNPDDKNYMRLRKTLRHPLMKMAIQKAPGKLVQFIGENWSKISRQSKKPYVNEKVRLRARQYAIETVSKKEYDLIIFGHIHIRDEFKFEFNGKQFEYVNLGSWLDVPATYEITPTSRAFINLS